MSDASIRTSALCVRRNHSDVRALCPTLPLGVRTLCPTVDDGAGGSICKFCLPGRSRDLPGSWTLQVAGSSSLEGPTTIRRPTWDARRPRFLSDATIQTSALCVRRDHSDVRALCPTRAFGRPRFVSDATIRTSALCVRRYQWESALCVRRYQWESVGSVSDGVTRCLPKP